ncbi:MAG: hypothetical protein HGA96_15025 [Desulfobulbaceae bacterium]|nr:hypothetical protein [Desulfobulbaceae bacterium]
MGSLSHTGLPLASQLPWYLYHLGKGVRKVVQEEHGLMTGMKYMDDINEIMGACIEFAYEMGLADDQILKMKPVYSEIQKKQARSKANLKITEIELMEIMEAKNFDIQKAISVVNKNASLKKELHYEMLKSMQELRAILTDQQYKEVCKILPKKTDR